MDNNFHIDAIVVGAGPAGLSAALTIKRGGKNVVVLERGDKSGTKNMFGGAVYLNSVKSILPKTFMEAPYERFIVNHTYSFLSKEGDVSIQSRNPENQTTATVLRPKFDAWLMEEAKKEGVYIAPKTLVKKLIFKNGAVVGVKTEQEKYFAPVVILADGVNSLLARQIGLRRDYFPNDMVLSVKETLKLDKNTIEERFGLKKGSNEGYMQEFFGGLIKCETKGRRTVETAPFAVSFLYTFKDTISFGLGVSLEDLSNMKLKPYELLEDLKKHPSISNLIEGGQICEYSAHLIPESGYNGLSRLYSNGVMVVGDAAGLINSAHFEGTNFAIESGRLAGETAVIAINLDNSRQSVLKIYEEKLKKSFILKDMKAYRNVVSGLYQRKNSILNFYPNKMQEFFELVSTVDNIPKKTKFRRFIKNFFTERSFIELFRDIKTFAKIIFNIIF